MEKDWDMVLAGNTGKGILNNKFFIPFITTFICSIFIFWFELSNFTLSIDEEFTDNFNQTVMMGRWFHAILRRWILPEPFTPFASLFIGIIFLSLASSFMCKSLKLSKESSIVFSLLLSSIPQFAYQAEFSNQVDTVGLSILLASMSFCIFVSNDCRVISVKSLWAVILLVLSTSIYQSSHFITYPLTITACAINFCNGFGKRSFRPLLFAFISVLAVILYHFTAKIAQSIFGVTPFSYFMYLLAWGKSPAHEVIFNIYSSISGYFKGKTNFGLTPYSLISISLLLVFFTKEKLFKHKVAIAALLVLCALSPMLMIFVMGVNQPARVMMALPIAFACSFIVVYQLNLCKKTIFVASCILVVVSCVNTSKLFYSDKMARVADESFYNDIVNTIRIKDPAFSPYRNRIYIYGPYGPNNPWALPNADTFGASYFTWDSASNRRILAMLRMSNIADFKPLSESEEFKAKEIGKTLGRWPSVSSIGVMGDVIVVRLGDPWM